MKLLDLLKSDFQRHEHTLREPGVAVLANYRLGRLLAELPGPLKMLGDRVYAATALATELLTGSVVSRDADFGEATHMIHALNVRIDPGVKLGDRVGMMHEVTIGKARDKEGVPEIGDDCFIGVGATIRGPVKIGKGVIIGAMAVVTEDIPDGCFVMGVPAKRIGWPTTHIDDRGKAKSG